MKILKDITLGRMQSILGSMIAVLLLFGCMQGPWEYTVEKQEIYRGIWVYAHVIADRPLDDLCFEKLHTLEESYTTAFAFYDSAFVQVTGSFSDGSTTQILRIDSHMPNCFDGDSNAFPQKGKVYELSAEFFWDSAGTSRHSVLSASTKIPDRFSITHGVAPGAASLANKDSEKGESEIMNLLLEEFGDSLVNLMADSSAFDKFYAQNKERINALLAGENFEFKNGDSLLYLTGSLNSLSHRFVTDWSNDVSGVLAALYMDSTEGKPEMLWSNMGDGLIVMDTADYAEVKYRHRLIYMSQRPAANSKSNVMDSIPILNFYYSTGLNRLHFYGTDSTYRDYLVTAIDGNEDARVEKKYNIHNGAGFFSGMIADSMDVYIMATGETAVYNYNVARADFCRSGDQDGPHPASGEEGEWPKRWVELQVCREFYLPWCELTEYGEADCYGASLVKSLENNTKMDSLAQVYDVKLLSANHKEFGLTIYCLENGFVQGICDELRVECLESSGQNSCKSMQWAWCEDRNWDYEMNSHCGSGLVSYYIDRQLHSSVLQREVSRYCADHAEDWQCMHQ